MHALVNSSRHSLSINSNNLLIKQSLKLKKIINSNNFVKGSLYVCGIQGALDLLAIKKSQIGCILTCQKGYLLNHPSQLVRQYKYLPFQSDKTTKINQVFVEAIKFIKYELSKTNVLVHCLTGKNKSVAIMLAYFIKQYKMTLEQATASIQKLIQIKLQDKLLSSLKIFQKSQKQKTDSFFKDSIKESVFMQNNLTQKRVKSCLKNQSSIIQNPQNQISFSSKIQNKKGISKQESLLNSSIQHMEPKHFQMIYSSKHQKYLGVKRGLKSSTLKDKPENKQIKQKRKSSFENYQLINKNEKQQKSFAYNSKLSKNEFRRSLSTNQVLNTKNNSFLQVQNRQLKTQKSNQSINQISKCQISHLYLDQQKNTKLFTQQNSYFDIQNLSPSRIMYFNNANQNLNSIIKNIQTDYEKESNYVRIKYAKQMADLRQELNKVSMIQVKGNQQKIRNSTKLFSQYSQENSKQMRLNLKKQDIQVKLNGKSNNSIGRQSRF